MSSEEVKKEAEEGGKEKKVKRRLFVFGATSAIAIETCRVFAEEESEVEFYLVARNKERVEAVASDLRARTEGVVKVYIYDLADISSHKKLIQELFNDCPKPTDAFLAWGYLGDNEAARHNFSEAEKIIKVNYLSAVSLLTLLAERFKDLSGSAISVITSVAGDRGRKRIYVYGSAKGALSRYLQGLRNYLFEHKVFVIEIKPGFVDTPMTSGMKKNFLFASPQKVGRDIYKGIAKRKDLFYTPWFWRFILLVIVHIPEKIFKRLNI
ncbi:MAG: SDR family NAD(P)-dependent oxidoreductase [Candidatus Dadabacteria bacterium]|nr:MAG: SDR family NAD(P)-dependent oxidoreductase [Candidatus Dadabacteria bacterium]